MSKQKSNAGLVCWLIFAIFLWGGNNTGTKYILGYWPPIFCGCTRFLCAGLALLWFLRATGKQSSKTGTVSEKQLWVLGGLSLAVYILAFNWALRFIPVSHVALYLGAAPVWALLWEGWPRLGWDGLKPYLAAALALTGVFVLFQPALRAGGGSWPGELLGLCCSILWTNYGRQCRNLGSVLSGAEVTAATMWRAGVLLGPFALIEIARGRIGFRNDVVIIQIYCILAGGVVAFGIWNHALSRWPASQVFLFNNLIPLSTTAWASVWLHEPITTRFWVAMILIVSGVLFRQLDFSFLRARPS